MMVFGSQDIAAHCPATAPKAADESFQDWFLQGEALATEQNYIKALRCFEEAAILCPADLASQVYQAVCWIHLDQPEKALAIAETVLSQNQDYSQGWLFRGVALHRLGRYREAYGSYDRALGRPPKAGMLSRLRQRWRQLWSRELAY